MNIFRSYTFSWWQVGILKLALLLIGILIGAYWAEFWNELTVPVIVIAIIASVYSIYISFKK